MTDQRGYIYHRTEMSAADLRPLITGDAQGWAANPTHLWDVRTASDFGEEGRATVGLQEFRWRRIPNSERYDVLCLSVSAEAPDGFEPLANREVWDIRPTRCRTPRHKPDSDLKQPAIAFLAPNGAVQFVALIDLKTREGSEL